MKYAKYFEPIESDPEILTNLMHSLGVRKTFFFDDVLDYEHESHLPALALIVIFPESPEDEVRKAAFEAARAPVLTGHVKFLKQTIDNACGLVAILHCILNTVAADSIEHNSILYNAVHSNQSLVAFLEESEELEVVYRKASASGETSIPDEIKYHYVAIVDSIQDSNLYELDGERLSPLVKGSSSKRGFLLNDSKQIADIISTFAKSSIDCSVYKLRSE